jgi:ATP-dependent helicase/nuclease subunit A
MSKRQGTFTLPDAAERERAVGTFDRNLVITAGAGTGKTTLLVDRLVHLLVRNPDPLKMTEIVALTFTNKAANEMKLRLRERIQSYLEVDLAKNPENDAEKNLLDEVRALIERYQLSRDEMAARMHDALRNIERSDIGTIHSFAATLLRLYPLEAGVDPQFQEDDGKQFERLFDEQWNLWLDQELALNGQHADDWRKLFRTLPLDPIKELARSLCSEAVELRREPMSGQTTAAALDAWLKALAVRGAALIERHPEDRLNEKLVRAAGAVIGEFAKARRLPEKGLSENIALLAGKSVSKSTKGWSESDVAEAQELVRAAKYLGQVDEELTGLLWQLLASFAEKFREFFVHEGFVSFDGLLIRARNLVRDHLRVRNELKRQYRAIMIDEFQDTDPIQYEILLYLAERPGDAAKDWRAVKLIPGKVFVVGDPKQSIYAFRRADIEAYLEVVEKIIKAQNGIECRLTTNFRSNTDILDVVNGAFESLIIAQEGTQPPYIAIQPAPKRRAAGTKNSCAASLPKVMARKIVAAEEINAEKARRLEGESLARWLKNDVLAKSTIIDALGKQVLVQPKDVAILFRKLTDIHEYLEPFRRQAIRYVVEGERHFYAAKEIIDAVNLLRAIDNPHDRLALVGVLRSPLGGLTDRVIYELHRENLLDYRASQRLGEKNFPSAVAELYRSMARLHDESRVLPVGGAVSHIFASLPIKLLAACYFHGEQAVANLEKLRQQAESLGREGLITLKETIHQLQLRVLDIKEEGESVLAEENLDAVRMMSIHKAKGLEFPIVVLAGCHSGTDGRQGKTAEALFDWSSGLTGMRVGPIWDLAGLYIAEKARLRAEEEQKRVFYVATTRAREHLIFSCAPGNRRSGGSFLSMLDQTLNEQLGNAKESKNVAVGAGSVAIKVVTENLAAPGKAKTNRKAAAQKSNWQPYVDLWKQRRVAYEQATQGSVFVTPTLLKQQEEQISESAYLARRPSIGRATPAVIGDLAHRFLHDWDFSADVRSMNDRLGAFVDRWLPPEQRQQQATIYRELEELFHHFFRSDAYAELTRCRILGREVPLLMPWDGQIMEGVIDLIYERDGLLYLADYKTDRIGRDELGQSAERYRRQAEIYTRAARQSLGREVAAFKLIFLRLGDLVEIGIDPHKEFAKKSI